MSTRPPVSPLQRMRAGDASVSIQPASRAASPNAASRRGGRNAAPVEEIGSPPKGKTAAWRSAWRRAAADWPQLERRDRDVLADYLDVVEERDAAACDMKRFGRLNDDGNPTGAYRVWSALHEKAAKLRRDLAATTSTRERVPVRKAKPAAGRSKLVEMKEAR